MDALEEDHDFLTAGDVFTDDLIETASWPQARRDRPGSPGSDPARVRALLPHLSSTTHQEDPQPLLRSGVFPYALTQNGSLREKCEPNAHYHPNAHEDNKHSSDVIGHKRKNFSKKPIAREFLVLSVCQCKKISKWRFCSRNLCAQAASVQRFLENKDYFEKLLRRKFIGMYVT